MASKRFTDKYRKRIKRQKANIQARAKRSEFEATIWHRHLNEQHKQQEQAAKALRNERQDLVNHLSSLFWLRYYQQDPGKARAAYKLLELKRILKAVGWNMGMLGISIPSVSFGDDTPEPIDPFLFCDMHQ